MKKFGIVLFTAIVATLAGPVGAQVAIEPEGMMATVQHLADEKFRGRGIGSPELDQVAAFIATKFESVGLLPGGEPGGSWYQEWVDPDTKIRMRNVVGVLPGRNPELARESVVIGAHYDHLGRKSALKENDGKVHPGADDNASGIAVLLEMASRLTLVANMERPVVFVAFTGEETGRKGSRYFVQHEKRYPVARASGMINLDTVGRLGKGKLIILGAASAKEWGTLFQEAAKPLKLEIAESAQDLDSSDQRSFHEAGVPAVQLFTGPHLDYHRPIDTADKIDGKGLAKIAMLTRAVAFTVANLPAPLTRTSTVAPGAASGPRIDRKVTIGVIPDFTYNEQGVRLGGTQPGGPAEAAGMKQGDIIIQAGTAPISVLRDLSDILKTKQPGDRLPIRFLRNGREMKIELEVKER
ncbi:MAG: M20/M25/M40 family metallo-hydrolase [Nitrospirae bacterium]|nr:M20/M25/M40 family metallo-hydrolase [Nitrospirota bacterium]NTW65481.1 M20/M25/M40 family metallo-hydrolase [Nitrospirota bacterium]